MSDSGFAYTQARIQAQYAALPGEAEWQRLGAARTLSAWLEDARNGPLKNWVKGFSAQSTSADIERGVRALFLDAVDDTARAVPPAWRAAVDWCRWLALLPLFEHLRAGRPAPAWVGDDPRVGQLLGIAPMPDGDLTARWRALWLARWPRGGGADHRRLLALVARIDAHRAAFTAVEVAGPGAPPGPAQTWVLRRRLREGLRLAFHQHLLQPASPFIYLALVALDLERLRRALLDRALYPHDDRADQRTPLSDPDLPAGTAHRTAVAEAA